VDLEELVEARDHEDLVDLRVDVREAELPALVADAVVDRDQRPERRRRQVVDIPEADEQARVDSVSIIEPISSPIAWMFASSRMFRSMNSTRVTPDSVLIRSLDSASAMPAVSVRGPRRPMPAAAAAPPGRRCSENRTL
jgi:hypothetical protein